jgi:ribonuclease D
MSLLQLKNRDIEVIVVFDIYRCPSILKDRGGLRDLLESTEHRKILHDCRHDFNALLCQFNITMANVLDTQCGFSVLKGLPRHKRRSLQEVLEHFGKSNPHKQEVRHRKGLWEQRPLPPKLLQYAVYDVEHLEYVSGRLSSTLTGDEFDLWERWSVANLTEFGPSLPNSFRE